jgi:hypothetical protein
MDAAKAELQALQTLKRARGEQAAATEEAEAKELVAAGGRPGVPATAAAAAGGGALPRQDYERARAALGADRRAAR